MSRLSLVFACTPYDRMQALFTGQVIPEGISLNMLPLVVEETFWRQLRHSEFDVSEMSLSSLILSKSRGEERFIALPVFTSRFFRHSCAYVHKGSGIQSPEDLKGKVVGVPEYQMTAALWLRGLLQHSYGVKPSQIRWRAGGLEQPGRTEKLPLCLPEEIEYRPIPADRTLSSMLENGEIDALFTARAPSSFFSSPERVGRLFPDYLKDEEKYFKDTGMFPIMHCVVIREDVYQKAPWAASSLFKAMCQAKDLAMERLQSSEALATMLPWQMAEVERTRRIMGEDWWPYGFEKNRKVLQAACDYSYEQGLAHRRVQARELFAPETLDAFCI